MCLAHTQPPPHPHVWRDLQAEPLCSPHRRGRDPSGYLWPWAAEWLKQFMSSWSEEAMPLASSMLRRGSAPRLSSRLTSS